VEDFCLTGEISYTIPLAVSYKMCPKHGSELVCFKKAAKKLRVAIPIIVPDRKTDVSTKKRMVRVILCFSPQK